MSNPNQERKPRTPEELGKLIDRIRHKRVELAGEYGETEELFDAAIIELHFSMIERMKQPTAAWMELTSQLRAEVAERGDKIRQQTERTEKAERERDQQREHADGLEEKHEREALAMIDERDRAQDAISQAYYLIIGESPEWSNEFGYSQATMAIDEAQTSLRQSLDSEKERAERAEAELARVREMMGCGEKDDLPAAADYLLQSADMLITDRDDLKRQLRQLEIENQANKLNRALNAGAHAKALEEVDALKRQLAEVRQQLEWRNEDIRKVRAAFTDVPASESLIAAAARVSKERDSLKRHAAEGQAGEAKLREALAGLLEVISNDDLIPETVSYMQEARAALARKEDQ